MTTTYLAARFSRKLEMQVVAGLLAPHGIHNIASWVTGAHDYTGTPDETIPLEDQARFASDDLEEIVAADQMIVFTEEEGNPWSRGGRHVEFGFGLAIGIPMVIIGPIENIFYAWAVTHGAEVARYDTLGEYIATLSADEKPLVADVAVKMAQVLAERSQ